MKNTSRSTNPTCVIRIAVLILLAFAIMTSSLIAIAEGEDDGFISVAESKTITYSNYTGFTYNDEMLLVNANALSTDIAKASVVLATAAYGSNGGSIQSLLNQMGFSYSSDTSSYTRARTMEDNDVVAYTIGAKNIGDYRVYCIPIRGTGANAEWFSNFNLGNNNGGEHLGFYHGPSTLDRVQQPTIP